MSDIHPIPFLGPLAFKVHAKAKTETRRIVYPQPTEHPDGTVEWHSPRYDNGFGVNYLHTSDRAEFLGGRWARTKGERVWVFAYTFKHCAEPAGWRYGN